MLKLFGLIAFRLVILTGFHLMQETTAEFQQNRLDQLMEEIKQVVPVQTFIHFELASISDPLFLARVLENVLDNVDGLGLNEMELLGAWKWAVKDSPEAHQFVDNDFKDPSLATVEKALKDIIARVIQSRERLHSSGSALQRHQLGRIHFHCLKFHAVATFFAHDTPPEQMRKFRVENSLNAVIAGSLTASTQACGFSSRAELFSQSDLVEYLPTFDSEIFEDNNFIYSPQILNLHNYRVAMHFVPVLACKKAVKTVGLGDAISSAGLLSQLFSKFVN